MSSDPNALVIVNPIKITDAMVHVPGSGGTTAVGSTAAPVTNVPESDHPAWSAATTYALGARVMLTSTHKVYESLKAANLNKNPQTESLWWIEVSPTNRWALFDTSVSTSTAQPNNITYVLEPGQVINTIAALNLNNATEINVTMYSAISGELEIVYAKTIDLSALPTGSDWWSWFYSARTVPTQNIQTDLPSYGDGVIKFELLGGADLSVGVLLIGQERSFGLGVQLGARVGIQDYSRKETNDFGDTILVRRAFAKRANFNLLIEKSEVDAFQLFLTEIRATPCLWIGSTEYESTTLFGFYKNFEALISYPDYADFELEIEGLT